MDILQAVLDARPGAYARHDSLEELSEKLGLGRGNPRLGLLVANKALLEVCSPVTLKRSLQDFAVLINGSWFGRYASVEELWLRMHERGDFQSNQCCALLHRLRMP